jgi:outer membrane protein assembly factor BamB
MKRSRYLLSGLVGLCLLSPLRAADWPQFRGPGGTAASPEVGLPVHWSATENIRWRIDLPGRGLSNPVIAAGRIFLTACSMYKQRRLHVLCFDEATGKQLWERQLWATGDTMCHPTTCMAAPTPATDGERVYALFATGDLACFDKDGNLQWYRSLVGDYPMISNQVGMASSPILWNDILFLPMENDGESFAAGVDKFTGQNRWKVERKKGINWVTPQLFDNHGRTEILFQTSAETTAYDPETGRQLWSLTAGGPSPVNSPLVAGDMVFVAGSDFMALRPDREKSSPDVVWKSSKLKTAYASGLAYQGRVYAPNGAGILNCAEARTGKVLWQQRLPGKYWASPVAADGKIYLTNETGTTTVLAASDKPTVVSTNPLPGETILATPAIANGAIYLRSDQHLYCIGEKK